MLLKAGIDSTRSFYFAVQQLSGPDEVNKPLTKELPLSLAKNIEFLRRLPKLNGFNGLGDIGRNLRPPADSPLVETVGFWVQSGRTSDVLVRARPPPGGAGAGRRSARLRPDRRRLRSRRRLVDAGEALRFCAADAAAAVVQQRQWLLQLVQSGRYRARQRRGLLDPADDRADGARCRHRSRAASSSPGFPPAAP